MNVEGRVSFQVLEHVLTSLSGLAPKDVTGVMQFSGSIAQLSANPDKLTSNAKVSYFVCQESKD